jgi:hypothetical protein
MGIPSFVKRLIVGIAIALAANFLLKGSPYSQFVFLVGLAVAGFPGTIIIILTPLQSILTSITVGFWIFKFPLLYVWVIIDILDFLLHLPIISTLISLLVGIATLGIGWIILQIIKAIPWLIKIALILWFSPIMVH